MPAGPRIYVACLASYNAGHLHGEWIDADQDADSIHEEVRAMLEASPAYGAEEYAIHDYEGFAGWNPGEYASIEEVAKVAEAMSEHGEAIAEYIAIMGDVDDALEHFSDAYHGKHFSGADFAQGFFIEMWSGDGDPTEQGWFSYIDWDHYWHGEFDCDGWHITDSGHVFSPV